MRQILVRDLDDRVVETLRSRAESNGRSLEEEVRIVLTEAASPSPHERAEMADRIRALTRGAQSDSTALVREDRDER